MRTAVTIRELQALYGITITTIAIRMNCCISMISKLSNGEANITQNIQDKFQTAFPGYELVGGKEKWKEYYYTEKEKTEALETENEELKKRIAFLENKLSGIATILNAPERKAK